MANTKNLTIENARLIFRNFSGKESKFNPAGRRNFCVILEDDKLVKALINDGWNVRHLKPREEGDPEQPYLQVTVRYDNFPPKVVMITSNGKTVLGEDEVGMLDWADISNVDLIINPYNYDFNGKTGIKGYLKTAYVTIEEDEFEKKYADASAPVADDNDIPF